MWKNICWSNLLKDEFWLALARVSKHSFVKILGMKRVFFFIPFGKIPLPGQLTILTLKKKRKREEPPSPLFDIIALFFSFFFPFAVMTSLMIYATVCCFMLLPSGGLSDSCGGAGLKYLNGDALSAGQTPCLGPDNTPYPTSVVWLLYNNYRKTWKKKCPVLLLFISTRHDSHT